MKQLTVNGRHYRANPRSKLSAAYCQLSTDARGFVSIFSVLIIMSILALTLVGFSKITRQAQRRTIDDQLSTQAFYAAESAVNDAQTALTKLTTFTKSTCTGQDPSSSFNYTIDSGLAVGYSCVLISSPSDLQYDSVPVEGSAAAVVVPFKSGTGDPVSTFDVTWQGANKTNPAVSSVTGYPNVLTDAATWGNSLGALRLDLIPVDSLDRASLATSGYTFFLVPSTAGNLPPYGVTGGTVDQDGLLFVKCATSPCKATITLGGTGSLTGNYMLRAQSLYNATSIDIDNVKNASGTPNPLVGGQAVIDATGKANDVFRRIQVRIPLTVSGFKNPFGVESADSLCKRLIAAPAPANTVPSLGGLGLVQAETDAGVCQLN